MTADAEVLLPTKPPRRAPPVLTPEEACLMLRLPGTEKQQLRTLKYYRLNGHIKGLRCGRVFNYALEEVLRFIKSEGVER